MVASLASFAALDLAGRVRSESGAVAIAASLLALVVITRPELGPRAVVSGAMLMGGAIAGMHYIGMASMRMEATVTYTPSIVAASVLIAIVASLAALWLAFRFRSDLTGRGTLLKILGAVVLGAAISGMHYTGMAAARFAPGESLADSANYIIASGALGEIVIEGTIVTIVLALIAAAIDRNDVLRRGVLHGETAFLQKPFTPEQLARKVRAVLDRVS